MTILYEYYNVGYDTAENFYGVHWRGQTFTPSVAHTITSVWLRLYRSGSPGTVTVGIRATSSGHPTGADLCSGTTDGDVITTVTAGDWYEITLGDGYALSASVQYAIVVRAITGNASNQLFWKMDATSPTYAGGALESSATSGVSWSTNTGIDLMFEEWGVVSPISVTADITADAILKGTLSSSITANAVLTKTQSGSFTADAYLATIYTLYADAVLKGTQSASLIANAVLKKTQSSSLTADSILLKTTSDTLTTDAVLKGIQSNSFTANACFIDEAVSPKQYLFTKTGPVYLPIFPIQPISVSVTSNHMADYRSIIFCDATSGSFTVTLPDATDNLNKTYTIKHTSGSHSVIVQGIGGDTIDGAATQTLNEYDVLRVISDDAEWWTI